MAGRWSFFVTSLSRPEDGEDAERALALALSARAKGRLVERIGGQLVRLEDGAVRPLSEADRARIDELLAAFGGPAHHAQGFERPRRGDPLEDVDVLVPGLGETAAPPLLVPHQRPPERTLGDLDAVLRGLDEVLDDGPADEDEDPLDLEAVDRLERGCRLARELRLVIVAR